MRGRLTEDAAAGHSLQGKLGWWKAGGGRKEQRGGVTLWAAALIWINSQVFLLMLVKDERKVWAAPAGLPEISSLQADPGKGQDIAFLPKEEKSENKNTQQVPTVHTFSCCCSSLLRRANTVFVSLFLLIEAWIAFLSFPNDLITYKYTYFLLKLAACKNNNLQLRNLLNSSLSAKFPTWGWRAELPGQQLWRWISAGRAARPPAAAHLQISTSAAQVWEEELVDQTNLWPETKPK